MVDDITSYFQVPLNINKYHGSSQAKIDGKENDNAKNSLLLFVISNKSLMRWDDIK